MNEEHALSRLEWSVRALAQSATDQHTLFPSFVCVADELALEFEEAYRLVTRAHVELAPDRAEAIARFDAVLEAMSGRSNEHLWTDEAMECAPEWTALRASAREVIRVFGWSAQPPSSSPHIYVSRPV